MEYSALKTKQTPELYKELRELRKKLWDLRMQGRTGQVSHHHQFKQLRRDIARVHTVLTEKKQ